VPGQPALALLRGGQLREVVPVDVVVHGEPRPVGAGHRELLVQDQVVAVVRVATAAVLLVDLDPEQPGPAGGEPDVPGHHPVPLPLLVMGGDLTGDEGAHHVAERVVLGGEDVTLHRRAFLRSGMSGGNARMTVAGAAAARPFGRAYLPVSSDRNIGGPGPSRPHPPALRRLPRWPEKN